MRAASSVPWRIARLASSSAAIAAPPMTCGVDTARLQAVLEIAHRLLARADHHVVDVEQPWVALVRPEADVQPAVVDAFVVHPGELVNTLGPQRRPVHPAATSCPACGPAAPWCAAAGTPRAAAGAGSGVVSAPVPPAESAHAPLGLPLLQVERGGAASVVEELADVEADAARADHRHGPADGRAGDRLGVGQHHRVVDAGDVRHPRRDAGGQYDLVVALQARRRRRGCPTARRRRACRACG